MRPSCRRSGAASICSMRSMFSASRAKLLEAVARKLAAEIIAGDVLDFVRLVENHRGIFRQDRAEIVLAEGEVGEKKMMIDDDQVRFLRALVHRGDEAALKFGALLAGAEVAARVDAIPQLGVVGKKRQLAAVAGFGQLFPIADLREPVHFVDALQDGLALHLVHFLPAQKIGAALHQRGFQIRREMLLQEGHVLLEELLLKRFGGRRNDHAAAAANRGNQIRQRLACARARFDDDVLVLRESFVGNLRHGELRRPEFVSRMALFKQPAGAKNSFDGNFLGFGGGSFFRHGLRQGTYFSRAVIVTKVMRL